MLVDPFHRGRLSATFDVDLGRLLPRGVADPLRTGEEKCEMPDNVDSLEPGGRLDEGGRAELPLREDEG